MKKGTLKNHYKIVSGSYNKPFRRRRILMLFTGMFLSFMCAITGITAQQINTVAGAGPGFGGDGKPATCASFNYPRGVRIDPAGNLWIADVGNHVIRQVDQSTGIINSIVGTPTVSGYSGDGGPANAAQLNGPNDIAFDPATGDMYIADFGNNVVRKVAAVGGSILPTSIITTVAGFYPGSPGFGGDGGPATAALLYAPRGVDVDNAGNLLIADHINSRIRIVNLATGIINTFAGNGAYAYSGDGGPATMASMTQPTGVRHDPSSPNIYIADYGNNVIRVVDGAGIINTFAGSGTAGYSGDGGPANAASCQMKAPYDVAVDAAGNVYIPDAWNNVVRVVSGGIINTYAGFYPGPNGFGGDGGPAHDPACMLSTPTGIAVDAAGNVYVADETNFRIREISALTPTNYKVCTGSSVTINANIPGGTWATGDPYVSLSPTGASCVVTGISTGTATVTYTIACGITIKYVVAVNACCFNSTPTLSIVPIPGKPCAFTATATASSGYTIIGYEWTVPGQPTVVHNTSASSDNISFTGSGTVVVTIHVVNLNFGPGESPCCDYTVKKAVNCKGCSQPCPSKIALQVVDHDGFPCTFDGHVIVFDSVTCWTPYSYQWSLDGNTFTNYSTNFTNDQTMMPLAVGYSGTIQVIITFVDGAGNTCTDTLTHNVWCNGGHAGGKMTNNTGATGMSTTVKELGIVRIFPNPTTGTVNITSDKNAIETISVIDVNGKTIAEYKYNGNQKAEVSLEKLPQGSYMIRVNNKVSQVVNKISN